MTKFSAMQHNIPLFFVTKIHSLEWPEYDDTGKYSACHMSHALGETAKNGSFDTNS